MLKIIAVLLIVNENHASDCGIMKQLYTQNSCCYNKNTSFHLDQVSHLEKTMQDYKYTSIRLGDGDMFSFPINAYMHDKYIELSGVNHIGSPWEHLNLVETEYGVYEAAFSTQVERGEYVNRNIEISEYTDNTDWNIHGVRIVLDEEDTIAGARLLVDVTSNITDWTGWKMLETFIPYSAQPYVMYNVLLEAQDALLGNNNPTFYLNKNEPIPLARNSEIMFFEISYDRQKITMYEDLYYSHFKFIRVHDYLYVMLDNPVLREVESAIDKETEGLFLELKYPNSLLGAQMYFRGDLKAHLKVLQSQFYPYPISMDGKVLQSQIGYPPFHV